MASLNTKLIFDLDNDNALIEYYVDDEKISEFTYAAGRVSAGSRDAKETTYESVVNTLQKSSHWTDLIQKTLNLPKFPQSTFKVEIKKKNKKVKFQVKIGDYDLSDDEWDSETNMITSGAREAYELSWADYLMWRVFKNRFLNTIENFNRTN